MRNPDFVNALALENADLGIVAVVTPPMRQKDKHGNAKRKRKVMCEMCAPYIFNMNKTMLCFSVLY
jgi:hypothetical protein